MGIIAAVIIAIGSNQAVTLSMNISEFDDKFTKPLFYSLVSALILASVALIRVNIVARSSVFWYIVNMGATLAAGGSSREQVSNTPPYRDYKIGAPQFVIWQITKVLLFGAFFTNVLFGFAAMEVVEGNTLGLENLPTLFTLPFVTPPTDPSYSTETVVPMMPALLVLIPPLLGVIGLRLILYVGMHSLISVSTSYIRDVAEGKPRYLNYVSTIEALIGIGVLWTGFNLFFTSDIDYNTRYLIAGTLVIGAALVAFSFMDRLRAKVLTHMLKRDVYIRVLTIIAIAIIVGAAVSVNNSIADARKIEYLGPYTAQQIGVNRYLAELGEIEERTHDVQLQSISANNIDAYIGNNGDVLDVIRVWDWEAAFAKLKPEIGLIPYVDFEDNDILRFNNTLYWTASMKPILPQSVVADDVWYNEHLVYTHVPNGFLTLDATEGQIVDSAEFFSQRAIYYGEGGLLEETWSAYPSNREVTAELNGAFYEGPGGLTLPPPMSWVFEPNFLLSFPGEPVHIMRYKDINLRMETLYPYFVYDFFGKELDSYPVTDGTDSYWLVPLIFGTRADDVPWAMNNHYIRLVGYALIDTYDGDITLLKIGDDFFTEMFESQYGEEFQEIPSWLDEQIRYPVELFNWKTSMYNFYHVTDVETFIQANEFYEIPRGLDTYYIEAKPPGFEEPEFVGLLSLELRGSQGRNLAGFMIVQNDLPNLGNILFYEVPLNSTTKLIGPTAVREALDRDPDFAQLKTLLRNPRIGDNILYHVGEHDTYFIPVYTAGAGGVVAQLGTIAAVGAAFTGEYHVGLGETQEEAFEAYLQKLSGVTPAPTDAEIPEESLERQDRISLVRALFEESGIEITEPTSIQIPISFQEGEVFFYTGAEQEETEELISGFIDDFVTPRSDRILMWEEDDVFNFGTVVIRDGIAELHYVSVEVGS
ncbi:conserved hypothetical protein [Cenarchaeum symbiosum A]|uniref:Uncharacterized protein n=1 Tax=Cenarchaeum symbiosum (strain A) TaxID=414004 RepID=A0RYX0_CENSY|nr:conserved hypothetical protein [Cenarchaeum symbiosum A]